MLKFSWECSLFVVPGHMWHLASLVYPSWIKRSLDIKAILCLTLSDRRLSPFNPNWNAEKGTHKTFWCTKRTVKYDQHWQMVKKVHLIMCGTVLYLFTSVWLSGENHLSSTPRCTTAGISLKSNGVVTWRFENHKCKTEQSQTNRTKIQEIYPLHINIIQ